MSTDADFTLSELWEKGIDALKDEPTHPGKTYEVAPGIVGEMPWPTLQTREEVQELRAEMKSLFKDDATAEQFRALQTVGEGEGLDEDENPIREGITAQEFTQLTARVNCKQTVQLLDFDKDVEPSDVVPDMAAVVAHHFTKLRAGQNGQQTS